MTKRPFRTAFGVAVFFVTTAFSRETHFAFGALYQCTWIDADTPVTDAPGIALDHRTGIADTVPIDARRPRTALAIATFELAFAFKTAGT